MTTGQIKSRIKEVIENIPDNALEEILNYLEEIKGKAEDDILMSQRLRKILTEDKELLEKLAR
ncbi:hypothetical protein RQM65_12485 [Pricia sp. S334]|uniref:DUF2281 domain-containing protein n=1 Tax=Pricia mediterranea TaxID=3076079 RepID=A0ABU3L847_9FLAO|nr:hypothetical protein [Pricia sp. S334]MDT7829486.1 hypothetical protein [Pricia sp. S334]